MMRKEEELSEKICGQTNSISEKKHQTFYFIIYTYNKVN